MLIYAKTFEPVKIGRFLAPEVFLSRLYQNIWLKFYLVNDKRHRDTENHIFTRRRKKPGQR